MRSNGYLGITKAVVFFWMLSLCAMAARGAGFAGGTGEAGDPYKIATAAQLLSIGSDPELLAKHYILTASIDLKGKSFSKAVITTFGGVFDGDGHTIKNLRIQGDNFLGLFQTILQGAEVRGLGLVDADIRGMSQLGALASRNEGRVLNCYSTGAVNRSTAGGLIGVNTGTIADCNSTVAVSGGDIIGGLVGENEGTISRCHSTGAVTGKGIVGGLVGSNAGRIDSSYCITTVTGLGMMGTWIGGLVGADWDTISSCYADTTVSVAGQWAIGGLTGTGGKNMSCCYSKGSVTATRGVLVGGLVGNGGDSITSCYSVATVSGPTTSWTGGLAGCLDKGKVDGGYFLAPADGGGPDNGIGIPLTAIEMRRQSSFKGWDFWGTDKDGKADPWFMPVDGTPILSWQTPATGLRAVPTVGALPLEVAVTALIEAGFVPGTVTYEFDAYTPDGCVIYPDPMSWARPGAIVDLVVNSDGLYDWQTNPGKGTTAAPYEIQTPAHLGSLAAHPELWNKYFVLTADLDMRGRTYAKALIAPDTDDSKTGFQGTAFSGVLDAKGFAIRNLTIRPFDGTHDYVGLFGMIAKNGRIYNLDVLDADVEGGSGPSSYVGILAGYNAGKIFGCSVTGVIRGGQGDGLVGSNKGSLSGCHADVTRY